jgi:hypothetical protein
MTNVNLAATEIGPLAGSTNAGWKIGFIQSAAKAAQNDTWTVNNANKIIWAIPTVDATGVSGAYTAATNVITLTSATTGAHSALIIYM